jgi:hypothetical protein
MPCAGPRPLAVLAVSSCPACAISLAALCWALSVLCMCDTQWRVLGLQILAMRLHVPPAAIHPAYALATRCKPACAGSSFLVMLPVAAAPACGISNGSVVLGPVCAVQNDASLLHKYKQSHLESYMEDNQRVAFCPSTPWCGRAIEVGWHLHQ